MKKHFWQPIWKFEEVESELAKFEQNGWRLHAIHTFRYFEFVKSVPKNTRYFFTYNPTRSTEDMYPVEYSLKQNHNANPISGHLSEFLSTIKFFRVTDDTDVAELIQDRNIILKRILFKRILLGFTLLLLVLIPLIIGLVLTPRQFISSASIVEIVIISAYSICVTFYTLYNTIGWFHQRKKCLYDHP